MKILMHQIRNHIIKMDNLSTNIDIHLNKIKENSDDNDLHLFLELSSIGYSNQLFNYWKEPDFDGIISLDSMKSVAQNNNCHIGFGTVIK